MIENYIFHINPLTEILHKTALDGVCVSIENGTDALLANERTRTRSDLLEINETAITQLKEARIFLEVVLLQYHKSEKQKMDFYHKVLNLTNENKELKKENEKLTATINFSNE